MRQADVVVIGGGLHGCSVALQLALRGRRTVLLERRHVGRHASGINAGGVRTLGRDIAEVALSLRGMDLWRDLRQLVGDDCGFKACGQIKIAENDVELQALAQREQTMRSLGYVHERLIDRAELSRRVPALAGHCVGGLAVDDDGAADPYRTTLAFGRRARAAGAEIIEGEAVRGLDRQGDHWVVQGEHASYRAPLVVNAAGAWAAQVAGWVGERIPLRTRASMMIATERLPHFVEPVLGAVGRPLSFKQTSAGTLLIGGGQQGRADLAAEQSWIHVSNLARSAQAVVALFPQLRAVRMVRSWCGIEAETPDHLPVIGLSAVAPGLLHVFGFSGHGFQLGPICGVAVAELAIRGETDLPIAGLGVQRFGPAPQ
jgi:sarcosine oxidase subunit beta